MKKLLLFLGLSVLPLMFIKGEVKSELSVSDIVSELSVDDMTLFVPMYQKMLVEFESVYKSEMSDNKKTAALNNIKDDYYYKFNSVLVTEQNDLVMNTIPWEYIENRSNSKR